MRKRYYLVVGAAFALTSAGVWLKEQRSSSRDMKRFDTSETSLTIPLARAPSGEWPCLLGPNGNSSARDVEMNWPQKGPTIAWRVPIGDGYSSPIAMQEDVVIFHRPASAENHEKPGPNEVVTCLAAHDGAIRWQFQSPTKYECRTHYSHGPYSTPVMDEKHVYAWGTEGQLYCLRRGDGTLVWQRNLLADYDVRLEGYFPVATSPLLWEDRLILMVGGSEAGAGVVAVSKHDGQTLWKATDQPASYATPCAATLHGRPYVFVLTKDGLVALDPRDGREDWQVRFRANNPEFVNATSPIVHGDLVFVSAFSVGNLCVRILPHGYEELWRDQRRNLDSQYNPLCAVDGFIYGFAALDDTFRCLELRTGKLKWRGLRELNRGAAIATKNAFVILGTEGHVAMASIDCDRLEVLGRTESPLLEVPTYAFPALHRGRLLVRNHKELVSIQMK